LTLKSTTLFTGTRIFIAATQRRKAVLIAVRLGTGPLFPSQRHLLDRGHL
jgi:hypothetical protein